MSSGRLQILAAALCAASVPAVTAAHAHDPDGSWRAAIAPGAAPFARSWVALEAASVVPGDSRAARPAFALAAPRVEIAGATLHHLDGWSASLFVSRAAPDGAANDESVRLPDSVVVNARLTRRVARSTWLGLDVFNVFDHRAGGFDEFTMSRLWSPGGAPEEFLVHPGEPRGLRLTLRRTF